MAFVGFCAYTLIVKALQYRGIWPDARGKEDEPMETKVIGVERSCFRSRNGDEEVRGYNLYLASDIAADKGAGSRVERLYLSDAKAAAWGLDARKLLGHTVQALYNRWGKLAALSVTD